MVLSRFVLAICIALSPLCQAAVPAIELAPYGREIAGPRTEVMVLGSMHLSLMPNGFRAEQLNPLLSRLETFAPTVITIESVSGEDCDLMRRHPTIYPGVADMYCSKTEEARQATGLDVPEAIAQVEKTFEEWPHSPTSAQRRRMIALQLAADDVVSAFVQWLQLDETERRTRDGIDDALLARMRRIESSKNENILIGATMAARLGLQGVYKTDDHTADAVHGNDAGRIFATMRDVWASSADHPMTAKMHMLASGGDMLALYRHINSPDMLQASIEVDFAAALKETSPDLDGRRYVAWWETRNLRMVSNIRAAFAREPGARVLSIVGSSHKPYFDAYLDMMHDVEVVDVSRWLQP